MCPHVSQRWWEVSHRIGAPQLSHGASPPMVGWQEDAVSAGRGSAVMRPTVAADPGALPLVEGGLRSEPPHCPMCSSPMCRCGLPGSGTARHTAVCVRGGRWGRGITRANCALDYQR